MLALFNSIQLCTASNCQCLLNYRRTYSLKGNQGVIEMTEHYNLKSLALHYITGALKVWHYNLKVWHYITLQVKNVTNALKV